jgi:DNA invertase Pin-like site-specific DNA recombinase
MCHLIDCFASYERALIGARTKAALRVKKAKGQRVGAIPYGYRLAEDGKNLERAPGEQKVVKLVRRLRKQGKSLRHIAETLTRRGFETRTGGYWHVQTVSNIARI